MRALGLLVLVGCSSSTVIPPEDPTFLHAQERLERTSASVEAANVPRAEEHAFMQAEAMYRYRFARSDRGAMAVLAEAAGAITDLPVFQAYSGALDLVAVRYQSADAATQLWESFLARYPCSSLRSLALYRLGWSYRSTGVSGLPRDSDAAFDASEHPFAPAARAEGWKSKDAAANWSLLPGAGQIYVGDTASGIVRLAIAAAAAAAIIVPGVIGLTRADELTWKHDWPLLASGIGGLIVLSFDYTSSYEDAARGAVRFNERVEERFERAHPDAP